MQIIVELGDEILKLEASPEEVLLILHRALNTMEDRPAWAVALHDKLRDRRIHEQKEKG